MRNAYGYSFIEEFEIKRAQRRLFFEQQELKKRLRD
jgi:hypothetical protein